jgi:uncharacterized membrane protein YedE/YeeE
MIEQSYIYGLIGGLIIGLAGAVYLLGNGRIMGASGVIGGLVDGSGRSEWLHQRSWGLRNFASLAQRDCRDRILPSCRRRQRPSLQTHTGSDLMRGIISLSSGALFGLGLLSSGMVDTSRVQGWLDIFGDWDPTLAFVLGGAILPMVIAWRISEQRRAPLAGGTFPARPAQKITTDLAIGLMIFGAGWGLAGLCPGTSFAALSFGGWEGLFFVGSMIGGMLLAVPAKRVRLGMA